MKSYQQAFAELRKQNRAALIPFFVIGDPDFDASLAIVKAAVDAGADVLELGIPFSDPIADGPTIQKADIRAMRSGMNLPKALEFIRKVKEHKDIPIGLLMYYNLIQQYGVESFFRDFHQAGVNSVLVADLSIDDADEVLPPARAAGLDTVFMVTPRRPPASSMRSPC
jgi:tryptophan synthase alpha chain